MQSCLAAIHGICHGGRTVSPENGEGESDKVKSKEGGENNGRSKETLKRGHGIGLGEFLTLHAADLALGGVIQDHECIPTRFPTDYFSP